MSNELLEEIKVNISKRRNIQLVSLIKLLSNPNIVETDPFFKMSNKVEITRLAKKILSKYFTTYCESNSIGDEDNEVIIPETFNIAEQLERSISIYTNMDNPQQNGGFTSLTKEFSLYEATGNITKNLKQLFNALITIRPTSTQNERNFSVSGTVITKLRSRLSDKSVNNLCFLKYYFKNQTNFVNNDLCIDN